MEIAFCKIADRDDADENALAVGHGDRTQVVLAQHLAQIAQGVVLTDDNLAVHRNVLDARVEIGNEEGLFHMEILQCEFCLLIYLTGTCRNGVDAHCLFQMRVSDRRANGIRIRIAVPDDVDRLCNIQDDTSLSRLPHAAYCDTHYNIIRDVIQFLQK